MDDCFMGCARERHWAAQRALQLNSLRTSWNGDGVRWVRSIHKGGMDDG